MSKFRTFFSPTLVFLIVLSIGGAFVNLAEVSRANRQRQSLSELGATQAHSLQRQIDLSLSSTFALASILQQQQGHIADFDSLAAGMRERYGGISSLQLAPNGVVMQIYPLAGNEAAIGHDLLNDPKRRTEALAAIEARKLTLAGPFELIQGGVAVIGRLPVFLSNERREEQFWGFTIALIRLTDFFEATSLGQLVDSGYDYELSRLDPDSQERIVFARSAETELLEAIPFEIKVPNGSWTLSIAPRGGWGGSFALIGEIVWPWSSFRPKNRLPPYFLLS